MEAWKPGYQPSHYQGSQRVVGNRSVLLFVYLMMFCMAFTHATNTHSYLSKLTYHNLVKNVGDNHLSAVVTASIPFSNWRFFTMRSTRLTSDFTSHASRESIICLIFRSAKSSHQIPTFSCWCYNNLIIIVSLIVSLYLLYPYANIIFISHYFILVCACAIQDRLLLIPVPLASFMFPCRGWYWSAITHIQTLAWASIYLDITDGNPSMYLSIVIGYPLCTPELSSSLHFE